MADPTKAKGFFLTWTCFGTWLHGDKRGSVDDKHRGHGTPFAPPNAKREAARAAQSGSKPFLIDATARPVIERTIREVCDHRRWRLIGLNVRTNHVHVVVRSVVGPGKVLADLKAWCTRRLREAGLLGPKQAAWAEHGSTRWLWTDDDVRLAESYVENGQGPSLPGNEEPNRPSS